MAKLVMHPGVYPDSDALGARLRGIDKLEVAATNQWTPELAIRASIDRSTKWWVGTINDREEMVVGVAPLEHCSGWAAPWMLSTDKFIHKKGVLRDFLRRTPAFVDACFEGNDVLFNVISNHNHASKRWLRFAGFRIKERSHVYRGFSFDEFIQVKPGCSYDPNIQG